MEHICWLNGFKSSQVQGIKWASKHHTAAIYALDMDGSLQVLFIRNNCPPEPNGKIIQEKQPLKWSIHIYCISGGSMKVQNEWTEWKDKKMCPCPNTYEPVYVVQAF